MRLSVANLGELFYELIFPAACIFSIPFGIQFFVCSAFGWSSIAYQIGLVIGMICGFFAFLDRSNYSTLKEDYEKECVARKNAESRFIYAENKLNRALIVMTDEQRRSFYESVSTEDSH